MDLFTKDGRPLQVSGETVYSRSGKVVGRIRRDKVYGTDGRYVGTIGRTRTTCSRLWRTTRAMAWVVGCESRWPAVRWCLVPV